MSIFSIRWHIPWNRLLIFFTIISSYMAQGHQESYDLNVHQVPLHQTHALKLETQCESYLRLDGSRVLGKCLGRESRALMNEIWACLKQSAKNCLLPIPSSPSSAPATHPPSPDLDLLLILVLFILVCIPTSSLCAFISLSLYSTSWNYKCKVNSLQLSDSPVLSCPFCYT